MTSSIRSSARQGLTKNRLAVLFGLGACAVAGSIMLVDPPQREVTSLASFVLKLVPFVLAVEAIARLDLSKRVSEGLARVAVPACFLVFFTYFVPKNFFYLDDFQKNYVNILQLTPFIILSLALAFRLGGGSPVVVRRLGYAMILLMVSGIEDLAFLTVNHHTDPAYSSIPEQWTWASHIKVRIGHFPSKYEAFAFISFHVMLASLVLFLPGRAVRAVAAWFRRRPATEVVAATHDGVAVERREPNELAEAGVR